MVISPEPFIQKSRSLARATRIHLEVVGGRVRLAWECSDGEVGFMEKADVIGLGISYDMLLDALSEAGGAVDVNGHYPINDAIRRWLRKFWP